MGFRSQRGGSLEHYLSREDPTLPALTKDDIHSVMGLTMKEIQDRLHPSLPEERRTPVFDQCCRYEVEYLREHGGDPYPDLRPVMESLKSQGYALGIVSNCQCGYVDAFLSSVGVRDLFCDYEEWERTGLVKGENIRLVMRRNGFDHAVYIGDTVKDQEAAVLAGVPFIHAAYGFGQVSGADAVIHSLSELPEAIESIT